MDPEAPVALGDADLSKTSANLRLADSCPMALRRANCEKGSRGKRKGKKTKF